MITKHITWLYRGLIIGLGKAMPIKNKKVVFLLTKSVFKFEIANNENV